MSFLRQPAFTRRANSTPPVIKHPPSYNNDNLNSNSRNRTRNSNINFSDSSITNRLQNFLSQQEQQSQINNSNTTANFCAITQYILQSYFKVDINNLQNLRITDLIVDQTYPDSLTLRKLNDSTSYQTYQYFNTISRDPDISRCPIFALSVFFVIRWSHPNPPITVHNFNSIPLLDSNLITYDSNPLLYIQSHLNGNVNSTVKIPRSTIFEPSRDLIDLVFPWLSTFRQDILLNDRTNYKLHSLCELFEFMGRIIVQDLRYLNQHAILLPNIVSFMSRFIPELFQNEEFRSFESFNTSIEPPISSTTQAYTTLPSTITPTNYQLSNRNDNNNNNNNNNNNILSNNNFSSDQSILNTVDNNENNNLVNLQLFNYTTNQISQQMDSKFMNLSKKLTTENIRLSQQITQLKADLNSLTSMCTQIIQGQRQMLSGQMANNNAIEPPTILNNGNNSGGLLIIDKNSLNENNIKSLNLILQSGGNKSHHDNDNQNSAAKSNESGNSAMLAPIGVFQNENNEIPPQIPKVTQYPQMAEPPRLRTLQPPSQPIPENGITKGKNGLSANPNQRRTPLQTEVKEKRKLPLPTAISGSVGSPFSATSPGSVGGIESPYSKRIRLEDKPTPSQTALDSLLYESVASPKSVLDVLRDNDGAHQSGEHYTPSFMLNDSSDSESINNNEPIVAITSVNDEAEHEKENPGANIDTEISKKSPAEENKLLHQQPPSMNSHAIFELSKNSEKASAASEETNEIVTSSSKAITDNIEQPSPITSSATSAKQNTKIVEKESKTDETVSITEPIAADSDNQKPSKEDSNTNPRSVMKEFSIKKTTTIPEENKNEIKKAKSKPNVVVERLPAGPGLSLTPIDLPMKRTHLLNANIQKSSQPPPNPTNITDNSELPVKNSTVTHDCEDSTSEVANKRTSNESRLGPNDNIKYKLSRENKTIWDLYVEWYIGINGRWSIKKLIEQYGWRRWKVSDDSHFFPTRRVIMDYIETECDRGIKLGRFTKPDQPREDIRKIIVSDLEKFRINNGLTLNSLSLYFRNLTRKNKDICIFKDFKNWNVKIIPDEEKNRYSKRQHLPVGAELASISPSKTKTTVPTEGTKSTGTLNKNSLEQFVPLSPSQLLGNGATIHPIQSFSKDKSKASEELDTNEEASVESNNTQDLENTNQSLVHLPARVPDSATESDGNAATAVGNPNAVNEDTKQDSEASETPETVGKKFGPAISNSELNKNFELND